jgi:hypothetical protein
MTTILVLGVLGYLAYYAYREGKRRGSRQGFSAGRGRLNR